MMLRKDVDYLVNRADALMQLPIRVTMFQEQPICHLILIMDNIKEKRLQIVFGLNDPEPSAAIRFLSNSGGLICNWEGHEFTHSGPFYPDDNDFDFEEHEIPGFDHYLAFHIEVQ